MKKAKLLLFLVMILVVASMVLFACGDKDAHDCKDENFDHKCDVCEKELSACKDEDNDGFCDICNEYIGCLSFTKNQDNTYSVYRCDGSRRDVIIPSTYKGLPVTSIGNDAFYKCTSLTSIEIPSSVTSIGEYAFAGCRSLTSIEIPSSVTSIGDGAFADCTSLTSIEIPSSVTSIGEYTFYGCKSLTSVVIPSSVTSIGDDAFYYCTSLTSIEIPSSVTSIDDRAFDGCKSLTIYCEAESKPSGWGYSWNSNRPVVWGYDARNLKIIDGVHYYIKDGSAMVTGRNANVTNVTILSTIENNGYTYSVTNIGYGAFDGYTSLTSVVIPSSVTSIGDRVFSSCTSLASIEIPSSVTSIDSSTFYGCTSLASIEIPSSVTSIGDGAFSSCTSLTIYCEAESEPSGWHSYWNGSRPVVWGYDASNLKIINGVHYYIKDGSAMVTGRNANVTNVTILSTIENNGVTYSVTSIGDRAFSYCTSLTSVVIPSSVTSIGDWAFRYCTSLASVVIEDGVTSIGEYAFSGCRSLTSIEIPSSVTSIGNNAFYDCRSLTSVVIPSSVTSIGNSAFAGCWSLTIYCEAESQPSGWGSSWNYSDRPVVWGYSENA